VKRLCGVLMVIFLAACGGKHASPPAARSPLWKLPPAFPGLVNQRIAEPDASNFWASDTYESLAATVSSALGMPKDATGLSPIRATGRSFTIDGAPVAFYARSWHVGALKAVSLISYAVTRGTDRIDWAELFVPPRGDREGSDALDGAFERGTYDFIVVQNGQGTILTPEVFSAEYVAGAPQGTAGALVSVCDASETACSFGWSFRLDLIASNVCFDAGDGAALQAGAFCFALGGPLTGGACGVVAGLAVTGLCSVVRSQVTGVVADTVCKLLTDCTPGSPCDCPFRSLCMAEQTVTTSACAAVASWGLCGLVAKAGAATTGRLMKNIASELDGDFFNAVCSIDTGMFLEQKCEELIGVKCPGPVDAGRLDAGVDAAGLDATPDSSVDTSVDHPVPVAIKTRHPRTISAGADLNTCVVFLDGSVGCWGRVLGGDRIARVPGVLKIDPVFVSGVNDAVAVSLSAFGAGCVIHSGGTVSCWETYPTLPPVPKRIEGITGAVDIDTGVDGGCVVTSGGELECWGSSGNQLYTFGQQGPPTSFKKAPGISNATYVRFAESAGLAGLSDGRVLRWYGSDLLPLENTTGVELAVFGDFYVNFLLTDGTIMLGSRAFGATGPKVPGINNVKTISRNCALLNDGSVVCGTHGSYDQPIKGITSAVALTNNFGHGCVVLSNHGVQCFGRDEYGALGGFPGPPDEKTAVTVPGIDNAAY
jgi:hypothetical protein